MTSVCGVTETAHHLDKTVLGNGQDGNIIRETGRWGQREVRRTRGRGGKMAWDPDKRRDWLWTGRRKQACGSS